MTWAGHSTHVALREAQEGLRVLAAAGESSQVTSDTETCRTLAVSMRARGRSLCAFCVPFVLTTLLSRAEPSSRCQSGLLEEKSPSKVSPPRSPGASSFATARRGLEWRLIHRVHERLGGRLFHSLEASGKRMGVQRNAEKNGSWSGSIQQLQHAPESDLSMIGSARSCWTCASRGLRSVRKRVAVGACGWRAPPLRPHPPRALGTRPRTEGPQP